MGMQIIQQPGGKLAVFCSNTDTIIIWDASADELVEWFVKRAAERARQEASRDIEYVIAGEPRHVYYQFTMTWEQALAEDRDHDGEVWKNFPEDLKDAGD